MSYTAIRYACIVLFLDRQCCLFTAQAAAQSDFEPQELGTQFQVGYAVRVLDMNHDDRLDIAIVDSKRVLWLESPDWIEHVIYETLDAKFDNVCFAPHDIRASDRRSRH